MILSSNNYLNLKLSKLPVYSVYNWTLVDECHIYIFFFYFWKKFLWHVYQISFPILYKVSWIFTNYKAKVVHFFYFISLLTSFLNSLIFLFALTLLPAGAGALNAPPLFHRIRQLLAQKMIKPSSPLYMRTLYLKLCWKLEIFKKVGFFLVRGQRGVMLF